MEIEKLKSQCFDLIRQREQLTNQIQKLNSSIQNLYQEINKQELNKKNKNDKK
jgi:prefoldin subunit 5